ncbi:MAG: RNA polymerase sigma factor [Alicyclobacillus sp.]|nr:RNA polymerase sigma factor [Alicyclobacillus sp.]
MTEAEDIQSDAAAMAIERLFERYADDVYRYARFALPVSEDARDVVQEVFLRAFRAWHKYRGEASERTWLFQIARHHIYDILRRTRTARAYQQAYPLHVDDVSVRLDTLVELEELLKQLTPDQRQVFVLRYVEDLTTHETAEVLGWSEAKVKTTLHRAVRQLQTMMMEETQKEGAGHDA